MTKYFILADKYVNANTAEYGYGDAPKRVTYVAVAVEADTVRKAMNAAKRKRPGLCFSGINASRVCTEEEMNALGRQSQVRWAKQVFFGGYAAL